jgi:integrase
MPKPITFEHFEAEVLKLYQSPSRRPATRAKVAQALRELKIFCEFSKNLDPGKIADWMAAHPDRTVATHRSLLSALRAACSYGAFRGWLENPFAFRGLNGWFSGDELEEGEEDFPRHRSVDDVVRVLRQADLEAGGGQWVSLRDRAVIYTAAFTGAGNREILGLRTKDLDLARGVIRFRSHPRRRLKTRARAAVVGVSPPLAEVLAGWLPHTQCEWLFPHKYFTGPWLNGSVGAKPLDRVKALAERAGVKGLTLLSLRHTVGTHAEAWGLSELELQSQLRHSRRQTQKHYRHADLDLRRQTAAKIRYDTTLTTDGGTP